MSQNDPQLGEKHYTSTVFLVTREYPRRVLLVHHKKFDKWMPPGGHQEKTENPYEAAVRETKEETGIDVTPYLPQPRAIDDRATKIPLPDYILEEKIDAREDQPEHYHLDMIYIVVVPYRAAVCREYESSAIRWFTLEEVDGLPVFENIAMTIRKILAPEDKAPIIQS